MSAIVTAAVAITVGTAYSIYSGEKAAKQQEQALEMQRQAQAQAMADAKKQAQMADEATNKANRKTPNMPSIVSMAGGGGNTSATMLTGPQGVGQNQLQLGKTTLLGG